MLPHVSKKAQADRVQVQRRQPSDMVLVALSQITDQSSLNSVQPFIGRADLGKNSFGRQQRKAIIERQDLLPRGQGYVDSAGGHAVRCRVKYLCLLSVDSVLEFIFGGDDGSNVVAVT